MWYFAVAAGTNRDSLAALQQINKCFEPDGDDKDIEALRESLWSAMDDIESELDRLVRELQYPETRMSHLLKLIGDKVIQFIQRSLAADAKSGRDVWRSSLADAERELSSSIALCEQWTGLSDGLVRAWRDENKWKQDFKDKRLGELLERLRTLLDLRRTQDALQTLLGERQEKELRMGDHFQRFSDARALQVNAYSNAAWEGAMSDYNLAMDAAIAKVAEKLQNEFQEKLLPDVSRAVKDLGDKKGDMSKAGAAVAQPYQILKDFSKYKDLIQRPAIAAKLREQRGELAKTLKQYVEVMARLAGDLEGVMDSSEKAPKNVSGKNLSSIANSLVFTSQLLHKLHQLKQVLTRRGHASDSSRAA